MLGIIGSRNFPFEVFNSKINDVYRYFVPDSVVTGDARGIDTYVRNWCEKQNIDCQIINCIFPENKSYYLHRNAEIVAYSDVGLIAFWDGMSRGAEFTMDYAVMRNRKVLVVMSDGIEYWYGENIN